MDGSVGSINSLSKVWTFLYKVGKLRRDEKEKLQMKKILAILLITLSFPSFGMNTGAIRSYVYCVEGYKFLYVYTSSSVKAGVSVTQIYKSVGVSEDRHSPMACDGTEPKEVKREPTKYGK